MNNEEIFFNLNPVNFFIISGIVQNFIIGGVLFFRQGSQPTANKLLSATIIIVTLHLAYLMLLDTNLDNLFPYLLWIPYSYLTAIGPLLYFYTKALTSANLKSSKIGFRHFVPLILEVLFQTVNIIYCIWNGQLYYNTPFYFYIAPLIYIWTAGSILYYWRLSLGIIGNHEVWALKNFSNMKEVTLKWLQKLMVYYRVLWIIWIPFVIMFVLFFRFQLQYIGVILMLYILMLVLTYLTFRIGLEGFGHVNSIILKRTKEKKRNKNFSSLTQIQVQNYINKMEHLMTKEKIYLNENLDLREFASYLKIDPNLVSFILNNHLESNFHDFVNGHRITEVKNRLDDPTNKNMTLLGIALDSGFNSKTTFNRVFKKITGSTPSEFQKSNNSQK